MSFALHCRTFSPAGVAVLFLTSVTLYVAVGASMVALSRKSRVMIEDGISKEIKLVIGLVHNGKFQGKENSI